MSGQVRPPLRVPRGLGPVVRFTKLPPSARSSVRKVLDADEEFRSRVAVGADEAGLPRPAWLFLRRPEGWNAELAELVREASAADADARSERSERTRRRQLEVEAGTVQRLEAALAVAHAEAASAASELAAERKLRRDADGRRAGLERRATSLEGERDSARRQADASAASAEALAAALEAVRVDLATAGRELRAAEDAAARARASLAEIEHQRDLERARADRLARRLATAAEKATALGSWLRGEPTSARPSEAPGSEAVTVASDASPSRLPRPRQVRPKRTPCPLPPGVFDDSPEAADHLVRVPKMAVLVDGYNATLSVWQELPIAEQRARLLDACGELSARTGVEVIVVFDGADPDRSLPPARGRRRVRLMFSPPDIEADDVLLDLVDGLDVNRAVTVASNDRRVREGATERGANAVSTAQLFAVLRRNPGAARSGGR
ncbi:MAG: hypothetical protein NVS1B12_05710 [Acidimicrobiales bacterium]